MVLMTTTATTTMTMTTMTTTTKTMATMTTTTTMTTTMRTRTGRKKREKNVCLIISFHLLWPRRAAHHGTMRQIAEKLQKTNCGSREFEGPSHPAHPLKGNGMAPSRPSPKIPVVSPIWVRITAGTSHNQSKKSNPNSCAFEG